MAHNDLKHTWEKANIQFVENMKVQGEAFTRVWNILTPEQRIAVQQQQQSQTQQQSQHEPQVGQLIDLQSPQTSPQPTNQQVREEWVLHVVVFSERYKILVIKQLQKLIRYKVSFNLNLLLISY